MRHGSPLGTAALFCAFSLACSQATVSAQRELAAKLRLRIDSPTAALAIGGEGALSLSLENLSGRTVSGCLTDGYSGCSLHARHPLGWKSALITPYVIADHLRCSTRFRLSAGEALVWTEPFLVPEFPTGTATLSCTVRISTGHDCSSKYGCHTASLREELKTRILAAPATSQGPPNQANADGP